MRATATLPDGTVLDLTEMLDGTDYSPTQRRYVRIQSRWYDRKEDRYVSKDPRRDNRKQKLYSAEDAAICRFKFPELSLDECGKVAEKVRRWILKRKLSYLREDRPFPWMTARMASSVRIRIEDGRGRRFARGSHHRIILPRWARRLPVVLHEVVHSVDGKGEAPHGREFAARLLQLVKRFIGPEAEKFLRAEYKKRGVRYRKKKELRPETLKLLREKGRRFAAEMKKRKENR